MRKKSKNNQNRPQNFSFLLPMTKATLKTPPQSINNLHTLYLLTFTLTLIIQTAISKQLPRSQEVFVAQKTSFELHQEARLCNEARLGGKTECMKTPYCCYFTHYDKTLEVDIENCLSINVFKEYSTQGIVVKKFNSTVID